MKPRHCALCDLKRYIDIKVKLWNVFLHIQNSDVVTTLSKVYDGASIRK